MMTAQVTFYKKQRLGHHELLWEVKIIFTTFKKQNSDGSSIQNPALNNPELCASQSHRSKIMHISIAAC